MMSCAPGSNCCLSCRSTGLGDYPIPAGSHSIPYHLNESEIQEFISLHAGETELSNYLFLKTPPWGIIVTEAYGELLVWFDASGVLHVVDVTNMSIAGQVKQAPFESPDSSLLENLQHSLNDLFGVAQGVGVLIGIVALAYVVFTVARK